MWVQNCETVKKFYNRQTNFLIRQEIKKEIKRVRMKS